jgi:hypothetical protein
MIHTTSSRVRRPFVSARAVLLCALAALATVTIINGSSVSPAVAQQKPTEPAGTFPRPSVYPKSWELKFEHGTPQRIVVDLGDGQSPRAFWYLTYTVTNTGNVELPFFPVLELMSKDGQIARSDDKVPPQVFNRIKAREKNNFLESQYAIGGELRIGPDQAREGVAIWPEISAEMGNFSIFVSGLSGEYTFLKDATGAEVKTTDDKPVILRKTLQLNYLIRGDEVYPGEDVVNENAEEWVMR